jgi:hypothetical protein
MNPTLSLNDDKTQIATLASCHFIEHGENVVLQGPPGIRGNS